MTSTITSTHRYRRLLPTFVVPVGVLRSGATTKPQFALVADVGMAIETRDDLIGVRTP